MSVETKLVDKQTAYSLQTKDNEDTADMKRQEKIQKTVEALEAKEDIETGEDKAKQLADIRTQYGQLCMQLGNITLNRENIVAQEQDIRSQIAALDARAGEIKNATSKG